MFNELRNYHKTNIACLKKIYLTNFTRGYRQCYLLSIFGIIAGIIAEFSFAILGTLLTYFIDGSDFPLPLFYQLSFLPPIDWFSYAINFLLQCIFCSAAITIYEFTLLIFILFASILLAKLENTIEIVSEMDAICSELSFKRWVDIVMESINDSKK